MRLANGLRAATFTGGGQRSALCGRLQKAGSRITKGESMLLQMLGNRGPALLVTRGREEHKRDRDRLFFWSGCTDAVGSRQKLTHVNLRTDRGRDGGTGPLHLLYFGCHPSRAL